MESKKNPSLLFWKYYGKLKKIRLNGQIKKWLKILAAVLVAFIIYKIIFPNKYLKNPAFCQVDADCELYECSNCGNTAWIGKTKARTDCDNPLKNLTGCSCANNLCRREYVK